MYPQSAQSGLGPLMAIGGAEDKIGRRTVLRTFVDLAGGEDAVIAVVPTASSLGPEVVEVYDALFRKLGAKDVVAARPQTREDADDPDVVAPARPRHRHLHDRRQPAQAVRDRQRHRRSGTRSRPPGHAGPSSAAPAPAPASSPRTWWPSVPEARPRSSG